MRDQAWIPGNLPSVLVERLPKRPLIARPNVDVTLIRNEHGQVRVNPVKKYLRPYWLVTEPNVVPLPNPTVDPRPSAPIPMLIDNQGPLEIYYSMFQSDGPFTITMFDAEERRILSNRELHIRTFAGTAERPLIWPEPLILHPEYHGKVVFVQFRNLAFGLDTNNVRFTLHGRRLFHYESPPEVMTAWREYCYNRRWSEPYFLTTDTNLVVTVPMGAGAIQSRTMRVTDDADFEWFKSMIATNPEVAAPNFFDVRLREVANQRPLMNDFIRGQMFFGDENLFLTGTLPMNLFEPTLFERNYKLELSIRQAIASNFEYFPTFIGRKIFHADRSLQS